MRHEPIPPTARLDADGRLVAGEQAFLAMNARAGGGIGLPLAAPPLALVVRLARRLGIPVTRAVTIADGDADLTGWVRACPADDGVTLTLADLREHPPHPRAAVGVPFPPGASWTWEIDAGLRLRQVAAAGRRHGFDPGAAPGQPLTWLFAFDPAPGGMLPILEALTGRHDFEDQPATIRASGEAVLLSAVARHDAGGSFAGYAGGVFPVPDPAAETRPTPAAKTGAAIGPAGMPPFDGRLERALRGPIGRVIASADRMHAVADGPLSPHYADYAADIANAGRHLLGLVDDLADVHAIEREDFTVSPDAIDLADVARRAAGLHAVRAGDAGVTIDRPLAGLSIPATGEFRRTLQILVNIVGNAVRYAPKGSRVAIDVRREGDRAVARVADRGKGIAPADQARIFGKFERVDPHEPGGSGLGLYIARRLARAMGGDVTVASRPDEGATFTLTLPARDAPSPA